MDPEAITRKNYIDLNRVVVGFLSILVPLSSSLAGCVTYQFMKYSNTKSFLMMQAQNDASSEPRSGRLERDSHHKIRVSKSTDSFPNRLYEKSGQTGLGGTKLEYKLKMGRQHSNPTSVHHTGHLNNPFKVKLFDSLYEYLEFFKDMFNLIALVNLALNLISMALEIKIFKKSVTGAIMDTYSTKVYHWPQLMLLVVNFLISTGTRIYFARLASTMLRSPKLFLIGSLVLLLLTTIGMVFQTILVHAHPLNYEQVKEVFNGKKDETFDTQNLSELDLFFTLIRRHKLSLDFFQLVWIAPVFLWHLLIFGVLLSNFIDGRKRCRFGSIDGKSRLAIMLMFETLLISTGATCVFLCVSLVIGGKLDIDFQRLSMIQIEFDSIIARLNLISIFCSFQHRVNDGMRLAHNLMLTSQKARNSTFSGIELQSEGIAEDASYSKRQSGIGASPIEFTGGFHVTALREEEEDAEGESQDMDGNGDIYEIESIAQGYPVLNMTAGHGYYENPSPIQSPTSTQRHQSFLQTLSSSSPKTPQKIKSFNKHSLQVLEPLTESENILESTTTGDPGIGTKHDISLESRWEEGDGDEVAAQNGQFNRSRHTHPHFYHSISDLKFDSRSLVSSPRSSFQPKRSV